MESIIGRIEELLRTKNLTPSKFADVIGVQRSGISHIMSGRNKPSLDFILKVLEAYPELNAEWLIRGEGNMSDSQRLFDFEDVVDKPSEVEKVPVSADEDKVRQKKIVKVLVFYDNQSFEEIVPRN
jgi:transcriptional regulator with XRE-family HTH domain